MDEMDEGRMEEDDVLNVLLKRYNKVAGLVPKGLPDNQTFGVFLVK